MLKNMAILDMILSSLNFNEENMKESFNKIKQYYITQGISFDDKFDDYVDNILNMNFGNVKGAFLEILSYNLISAYCNNDALLRECKVTYNGEKGVHPFDLVLLNE